MNNNEGLGVASDTTGPTRRECNHWVHDLHRWRPPRPRYRRPTYCQGSVEAGMTAEGDTGAIQDASETLVAVLENGISIPSVNVVLSSPNDVKNTSSPTVGLFLYDVEESPHANTVQPDEVDAETVRPPPVVVDLHYLMTAYPSGAGDETKKTKRAHSLLGEAMWVLREVAIIRGTMLRGELDGELRVSKGDSDDVLMDIWNTFPDAAYLPSVPYTVGPVALVAGEPEAASRVKTLTRRGDSDDG